MDSRRETVLDHVPADDRGPEDAGARNVSAAGLPHGAQAFFDVAPVGLGLVDAELRFLAANAVMAGYIRFDPDALHELVGVKLSDTLPPELWTVVEPHYCQALAGVPVRSVDIWVDRGSGSAPGRSLSLEPIFTDGEVTAIALAVTEEPMRRQAEEALRRRTALYAMLSGASHAVVTCKSAPELYDELCRVAIAAGLFELAWVGTAADDELRPIAAAGPGTGYLEGFSISLDPSDIGSQGPAAQAMLTGAPVVLNDFLHSAIAGPWRPNAQRFGLRSVAAFPFKRRGEVVATMVVYSGDTGFFTDELLATLSEVAPTVTMALDAWADAADLEREEQQRRAIEEQLRQSQKMEAIGVLAGGVAHDFNNTLTVIRNTCQLMLEQLEDPEQRARVEQIDLASDHAATLTRQLLTFSRRQVAQPTPTRLQPVIRATIGMAKRIVPESVTIEGTCGAPDAVVTIDPSDLQQVILNLIVNARDAMPSGGHLRIHTSLVDVDAIYAAGRLDLHPGRYTLTEVTDTGQGMDAGTLERIYEPFFTTKQQGTGLGLATTYGIVKRCGGDLYAYSEPGIGTTFKVYLPTTDRAPAEPAKATAPDEQVVAHGAETVLMVEDSEMLRPIVAEMLRRAGFSVLVASDGLDALEVAAEYDGVIDLLLTDVVMPRMNGRELASALAESRRGMRVIYTSGYPADTVVQQGIAEARVAFVQKPYVADELLRQVRNVLDRDATP